MSLQLESPASDGSAAADARRTLRLGQPVLAEDGPFGELADVIVDPLTNEITYLVVEPHGKHLQSRLVPLWSTAVDDEGIHVSLDRDHLYMLARCSFSQYVRLGEPIDVGDEWDVSGLTIHAFPYWSSIVPMAGEPVYADARFDRIPKDEIEVCRHEAVASADSHRVGTVEGVIVFDGHLDGVVVTSGLPGFRHHVAVPAWAIDRMADGSVVLGIDAEAFHELGDADGLRPPAEGVARPPLGAVRRKVSTIASKVGRTVGRLGRRGDEDGGPA